MADETVEIFIRNLISYGMKVFAKNFWLFCLMLFAFLMFSAIESNASFIIKKDAVNTTVASGQAAVNGGLPRLEKPYGIKSFRKFLRETHNGSKDRGLTDAVTSLGVVSLVFAVGGLSCALLGLIFGLFFPVIGTICFILWPIDSVVAIVCGAFGLKKRYSGAAIAGITLGAIGAILFILFVTSFPNFLGSFY